MQAGRFSTWRSAIENPQPLARALCIAVVVALLGVELWPAISTQLNAPNAARLHSETKTTRNVANIEQITTADLFGHAATQNANLPQTDLQVTLRAVFAASDPQAASAVIETGDKGTQMVKIGGAIGQSATLQAVYSNRVVLARNGALETLYFPTQQELTAANLAQNTALPSAQPSNTENTADANLPTNASAEDIKRAAILQRLEELRAHTPR